MFVTWSTVPPAPWLDIVTTWLHYFLQHEVESFPALQAPQGLAQLDWEAATKMRDKLWAIRIARRRPGQRGVANRRQTSCQSIRVWKRLLLLDPWWPDQHRDSVRSEQIQHFWCTQHWPTHSWTPATKQQVCHNVCNIYDVQQHSLLLQVARVVLCTRTCTINL